MIKLRCIESNNDYYIVGKEDVPHYDPMIRLLKDGSHTALVSDVSINNAVNNKRIDLIHEYSDGLYKSSRFNWKYAVPCNERGEPIV